MNSNKEVITFGYNHLEVGHPDNPKTYRICGALTHGAMAKGDYCLRPAGAGTVHAGVGRCKLHGGCNLVGPDSATYKTGRYAHTFKGRLKEHYQNIGSDETNPLDLVPELQVQRVMLSMALDRLDTSPKQPQASHVIDEDKTKEVGRDSDEIDNDGDGMVGGGGVGGLMVDMVPLDIARDIKSISGDFDPSNKPYMRLVRTEDIELVRELAGDIVNTVAKVVAMRNSTALTKAEIVYLMSTLKEAIGMFVSKENQEAFIRYIMDKIPIGEKGEEDV